MSWIRTSGNLNNLLFFLLIWIFIFLLLLRNRSAVRDNSWSCNIHPCHVILRGPLAISSAASTYHQLYQTRPAPPSLLHLPPPSPTSTCNPPPTRKLVLIVCHSSLLGACNRITWIVIDKLSGCQCQLRMPGPCYQVGTNVGNINIL